MGIIEDDLETDLEFICTANDVSILLLDDIYHKLSYMICVNYIVLHRLGYLCETPK